jgi:PTS system mannose-specific IIA component
MIGLVLVTHGALADEFKLAMQHVVGPQEQCEAIAIGPEDNAEERREDILAAIDRADSGDGVIVLTDMFGGTPSNLAISVMQNRQVEVIAGVNLPMLVKLGRVRGEMNLAEAVALAQEAGRKYITVANSILGGAS